MQIDRLNGSVRSLFGKTWPFRCDKGAARSILVTFSVVGVKLLVLSCWFATCLRKSLKLAMTRNSLLRRDANQTVSVGEAAIPLRSSEPLSSFKSIVSTARSVLIAYFAKKTRLDLTKA